MRTLNELYNLLCEYYTNNLINYTWFICNSIEDMYNCKLITFNERNLLKDHFKTQRPSENLHVEFYNSPLYIKKGIVWFGMVIKEAGCDIRIAFIEKMITITQEE